MITFLTPTYLCGLLALAVPLAIHLWSKKEGETIKIGSIQLLSEANPKQASSIQLNELWLLLLRLLLLALVVLILAEPHFNRPAEKQGIVYLVEPALLKNMDITAMMDSLPEGSIYLLKANFPAWERDQAVQNIEEQPNYWQLAQEIKNLHADSVVVFTRALLQGIQGKRPAFNANINWVILNPETVQNQTILAERQSDSIELISVNSNSNQLTFNTEKISQNSDQISQKKYSISIMRNGKALNLPLTIQDTLRVKITASDSLAAEEKYITASFRALRSYTGQPLKLVEVGDSLTCKSDVLVWLKNDPIPDISSKILTYKPDDLAQNLIVSTAKQDAFYLTKHLNSENIISENLTEQLLMLLDLNPDLVRKIAPFDLRSLSKDELQTRLVESKTVQHFAYAVDLSPWFWLALVVLLIIERITAFYRKQ